MTTSNSTIELVANVDLGWNSTDSRITGNQISYNLTGLTNTNSYTIAVKNNKNTTAEPLIQSSFTASGTSQVVSLSLVESKFTAGQVYYLAVRNNSQSQEQIQVSFTATQNLIDTADGDVVNYFSSSYTLSGNAINSSTNKVVDKLSILTDISTATTNDQVAGALAVKEAITNQDSAYLSLIPAPAPVYQEGRVFYDSNTKSLSYYDNVTGTSIQVGKELIIDVRNNTGSTITNGSAVYISGVSGQRPTIALALANAENTSKIIGVVTHNISNNSNGKVTVFGLVNDINTSGYNAGDLLYLSDSTPGQLVNNATGLDYVRPVGVVTNSSPSNGTILVLYDGTIANLTTLGTSQEIAPTQYAVKTYIDTNIADFETTTELNARDTANRARANHTGTQLASTISNFDTQVRTSRLDQMAVPTANLNINTNKLINVTDPTTAQDAATKNYVDLKTWTDLTLINGWANVGSPFENVSYSVAGNIVYLRGLAGGGVTAVFTGVALVPVSIRPLRDHIWAVDSAGGHCQIRYEAGVLKGFGLGSSVSFDGVFWQLP